MLLKPLSAYWPKIEIAPKTQLKAYQISVVTTVVLGALSAVAAYYIAAAILATAAITFSVLAYNKHKALNPTDTKTSSVATPAAQAASAAATQASTTPATQPSPAPTVANTNPQPAVTQPTSPMPKTPESLSRWSQDSCLQTLGMIQERTEKDKNFSDQIERMQESVRISIYDINKLPFANPCKVNVLPEMKFNSTDPITLATELCKNNPDDIIMIVNPANPTQAGGCPGAEIQEDGSFAPQQKLAGSGTEELLGRTTGYLFAASPAANQTLEDKLQEKYKTNKFKIEPGLSAITIQEVPVIKDYHGATLSSGFPVDIISIAAAELNDRDYNSKMENNFTLCMLAAKQRAEETNKRVQLIFCPLGFNSDEDKFRRTLPSILARVMDQNSDFANIIPHFTIESEKQREKFTKLYNGAQGKVTPVIRAPEPVAVASAAPATAPATAVASASGATSSAPAATPAGATSASTAPSSVAPATRKWKRVTQETRCGIQ